MPCDCILNTILHCTKNVIIKVTFKRSIKSNIKSIIKSIIKIIFVKIQEAHDVS
jgi:hypothetical protein